MDVPLIQANLRQRITVFVCRMDISQTSASTTLPKTPSEPSVAPKIRTRPAEHNKGCFCQSEADCDHWEDCCDPSEGWFLLFRLSLGLCQSLVQWTTSSLELLLLLQWKTMQKLCCCLYWKSGSVALQTVSLLQTNGDVASAKYEWFCFADTLFWRHNTYFLML